ncbi:MAG: MraY family glycosyltransferase [Pseudomonadota bacterium]
MDIRMVPGALIAALFCVMLLMALRPLAIALNFVDTPGGRKRHIGKVPLIGGLAMYIGFAAGAIVAVPAAETGYLLLGALLLLFVGLLDDRYDLPPSVRLGTQFGVVLLMYFGGDVAVTTFGDPLGLGEIRVEPFSLVTTVFFSLALINAINMTDGMDGLAGGMSFMALLGVALAGQGGAATVLAVVGLAAVVGFLAFNFPLKVNRSIRTFMGDGGSTVLGFIAAWLMISVTQPPTGHVSPAVALGFAAIPLYDLTSCFFRRIIDGRSPMSADRNHYHHILQEAGFRRRQALAILLAASVSVFVICWGLEIGGSADHVIFFVWLGCGVVVDTGLRLMRRIRLGAAADG